MPLMKLRNTVSSHTEDVQFQKRALFNRFLELRQQSMGFFSFMANHERKAGAIILRPNSVKRA